MFLHPEFMGMNQPQDLPDGRYAGVCSFSKARDFDFNAAFVEYTLDGEELPRVVDLLLIDQAGERYFRDFVRLKDRSWRDSYGGRSDDLDDLLPPEILDFLVLERREVGSFVVEHGHVR